MNNLYYIHKIRIFVDRFDYETEVVSFHYFFLDWLITDAKEVLTPPPHPTP